MSETNPLPEPVEPQLWPKLEDPQFWPKLVKWQTTEANAAQREGRTGHAQVWREYRADTVQNWASAEVHAATPPPHLPDGARRRGRKGR